MKEDLAYNGQAGNGVNKSSSSDRLCGNHSGLKMKEHFGNGPRTASKLDSEEQHEGPSVTKDKYKTAPMTAAGLKPIEGKATVKKVERK